MLSGFAQWLSSKESSCNAGDMGLVPGSGRSPGGGLGSPTPESHGQRSLGGCGPWGRKESDTIEAMKHNYSVI